MVTLGFFDFVAFRRFFVVSKKSEKKLDGFFQTGKMITSCLGDTLFKNMEWISRGY
jgi:hypothetical protein